MLRACEGGFCVAAVPQPHWTDGSDAIFTWEKPPSGLERQEVMLRTRRFQTKPHWLCPRGAAARFVAECK